MERERNNEMTMLTENYCDECDEVVHAVFDEEDFYAHRIGTVLCPNCGHVIMPCNECENHDECGNCPWRGVHPESAISPEAMLRYIRGRSQEEFRRYLDGAMGDVMQELANKIQNS